jgi:hypothetical protein
MGVCSYLDVRRLEGVPLFGACAVAGPVLLFGGFRGRGGWSTPYHLDMSYKPVIKALGGAQRTAPPAAAASTGSAGPGSTPQKKKRGVKWPHGLLPATPKGRYAVPL